MKKIVFLCVFFLFLSTFIFAYYIFYSEFTPGDKIELRYPVVLVHGIARNERRRYMQPWGRISRVLRENGIEVYYGNTDAWGNIVSNAELLKNTIDSILETTGHKRVNIIAHSKGGIDARYLIWKYYYGDKVASLTTISTPHNGSEIADFFFNSEIIYTRPVRRQIQTFGRIFGDVNPDIFSVNHNLTTENMREFNSMVVKDRKVFYQSIYSIMYSPSDDPVFSLSHAHIKKLSGENDGLVSANSANWGYMVMRLPYSLSHEQIIDRGGRRVHGMKVPNIYLEIVHQLSRNGF